MEKRDEKDKEGGRETKEREGRKEVISTSQVQSSKCDSSHMVTPRHVQVLVKILNFYCQNMSLALLTVKTYKYPRETPLDKFFAKNIAWSPLPPSSASKTPSQK